MASKPIATAVNIHNVYQYNIKRDILAKQQWIGTYEFNSIIEASAMPRKRVETKDLLSDESAAGVAGVEKGAAKGFEKAVNATKHISPAAKVAGAVNDINSTGQHLIQGSGAEAISEGIGVVGQGAGALVGAGVGAELGYTFAPFAGPLAPYMPPAGALVGGGVGALVGGKKMKEWGRQLTGGDTPDLMIPPKSPPNHADIQPTITTKEGYNYALVKVEGKYNWYAMMDDKNLMLPNRFSPVMRGEKIAELTTTYLKAAGYEAQVNTRLEEMVARAAVEQRQALRDAFRQKEIAYRNQSEQAQTFIKQGKAPDGSELGKMRSDNGGSSIWVHEKDKQRFTHVATAVHGKDSQSVEQYFSDKTGEPLGGKIYVPDGNGGHKITTYGIKASPQGSTYYSVDDKGGKISQQAKHLQMAHSFANEAPIAAVTSHGELADAYVAQAAFLKQIESTQATRVQKAQAMTYFNEKAIHHKANGGSFAVGLQEINQEQKQSILDA